MRLAVIEGGPHAIPWTHAGPHAIPWTHAGRVNAALLDFLRP